ncbi:MAG: tripartite tricarboxylate transporter TctB family protein [Rhodobacteraceae bacterium]|nr:tripartite tricarboxylate transporter TctB family protein [Paracoccaceae bacterium]
MGLDRWIACIFLCIALVYGYGAFFTMDQALPAFMQRQPIWPSTFPKVLAVLGILTAAALVLGLENPPKGAATPKADIDPSRLRAANLGQAALLVGLMIAYALLLRPLGFLLATAGFLGLGATILGECKFHILLPVVILATGVIWYLVEGLLGIYLRPLPAFF